MHFPRFRLRTLMIAVAVVAILCAAWAVIEGRRERSEWATLHVVNRRSSPLYKVRVTYPDGRRDFRRLLPGEEADCPIHVESEATVRVYLDGRGYAEWGRVRGGSRPTIVFSD